MNKQTVADRISQIFWVVGESDGGVSLPYLIETTGISKPTIHRLVSQLKEQGYLRENEKQLLCPGPQFFSVALRTVGSNTRSLLRGSILTGLSKEIDETIGISMPGHDGMVYYDRIQTNWPLQVNIPIGFRTPFYATASGKLYLSTLTKAKRLSVVSGIELKQFAKNTITDFDKLELEVKSIKQSGFSLDDEELIDGMNAIAVPIFDRSGNFLASLFCHCPKMRKKREDLVELLPCLKSYATELEHVLDFLR